MKMKSPFCSLPFTRLSSGFRSCAVAFSICAVLASGSASAQGLTQQQVSDAMLDALKAYAYYSSGADWAWMTVPLDERTDMGLDQYLNVNGLPSGIASTFVAYMRTFWPYIQMIANSTTTNLVDLPTFEQYLTTLQNDLQALSVGVASNSNLVELLRSSQQLEAYQSDLAYNLYNLWNAYQSAGNWHVWVDNLDTIEDWVIYAGGELSNIDSTLAWLAQEGFPVHGEMSIEGDVSILGTVDANVLNWPQYFTGYYDLQNAENMADVTYELTEASGEYEDGWNSQTGDMDQQVLDAEEAVADPTSVEDVTNAVDRVHLPSSSEVDGTLPIRQSVFDAVGDELLGDVDRNFNSSVLILPKNDAAGIIKLEWDGNDDAWQSFLETSGTLFENVWKVLYAVWLMFLIWHEYNFYFRTIR